MYNGKFSGKKRRLLRKRQFVILTSMALLLVGLVGGSLAYLFMSTQSVNNTFTAARVTTDVLETNTNDGQKTNVRIKNTGNISAYIRANVIINWQTSDGVIYGEAPEACDANGCNHEKCGKDYVISYGNSWTKSGDFWYHNTAVNAGTESSVLINSVQPTNTGKTRTDDQGNTYYLTVTILGSGIQAKGMDAANAQDAWQKAASN